DLPADPVKRMQARQRVLKDHCDATPAKCAQLGFGHAQKITTIEECPPRHTRTTSQPCDRLRCDALSGSGFSHNAKRLSAVYGERHVPSRLHDAVRSAKGNGQIPDIEQRACHGLSSAANSSLSHTPVMSQFKLHMLSKQFRTRPE